MDITEYTTYNDIRAALGVSEDEIEDATLSLDLYSMNLSSELDDVSSSITTTFEGLRDVAAESLSDEQIKFDRFVRLFSTYAVAKQLTTSLPLFSPKDYADGKASFGRYAQNPYKDVIKSVEEAYSKFRLKLAEASASVTSSQAPVVATRPYFSGATPGYDPVLGG